MLIEFSNDFHNSSARIRASVGRTVSRSQVQRLRRSLCGISGCTCSDKTGVRGIQPEIPGHPGFRADLHVDEGKWYNGAEIVAIVDGLNGQDFLSDSIE